MPSSGQAKQAVTKTKLNTYLAKHEVEVVFDLKNKLRLFFVFAKILRSSSILQMLRSYSI